MKSFSRPRAAGLLVSLSILFLFFIFSLRDLALHTRFGESDFLGYWSATYLLRHGENPYDSQLMETVQRNEAGSTLDATIMAWNPPFLFVFLLPLAWMSFTTAKFAWLLINTALIVTGGLMLIQIYLVDTATRAKLLFLFFVILFPAVMAGLFMGQVTSLVFWGLTACTVLMKRGQWFWAGAALILTTVKPHIAVLPVLYILIYMAQRRKFAGWLGLSLAGLACLLVLLWFRSDVIRLLVGQTSVASDRWATATIGGLLSYLGITEAARYLILLLLPLPIFLALRPEMLSPELSVALLTLITVPTTLFGWSYDQTILLIPIAQVFHWLQRAEHRTILFACILGMLGLNYYQRIVVINDMYYVWIPLFWWLIFGITWQDVSRVSRQYVPQKM